MTNKLEGRIEALAARATELSRLAEIIAMIERQYRVWEDRSLWEALLGEARSGYSGRDAVLGTGKSVYLPGEAAEELTTALELLAISVTHEGIRERAIAASIDTDDGGGRPR